MNKCCEKWKNYSFCPVCNTIFRTMVRNPTRQDHPELMRYRPKRVIKSIKKEEKREQKLTEKIKAGYNPVALEKKRKITFKYLCYCVLISPIYILLKIKQFIKG